jgi:hypothetical protein
MRTGLHRRRFLQACLLLGVPNPMALYKYTAEWAGLSQSSGGSQLNVNYAQTGGEFPFINLVKSLDRWAWVSDSTVVEPDALNDMGYPASNAAISAKSGIFNLVFAPGHTYRAANYVVGWSGTGTIYAPTGTRTGSNTGTDGRFTLDITSSTLDQIRISIGISAIDDGDPITDLWLCHADDEAALLAGEVFGVKFKERIIASGVSVIRPMDWVDGNKNICTTWATRKPVGYVFWHGPEMRASLYAGLTTGTQPDYTITFGTGGPVDKMTVITKIHSTATSDSVTLNLNGTGAVSVLDQSGDAITSGSRPTVNFLATFIYDAQLSGWLMIGGRSGSPYGLNNGVPPEICLQLCLETGCHPHFPQPYLTATPATDYMTELATMCKAKQDTVAPWMVPRFECVNELWNFANGFYGTRYSWAIGVSYGWGSFQQHDWYGKAISLMGQAVSAVFGDDRSKYEVLCGVQTLTGDNTAGSDARLSAAKYVATQGGSAASNWVTGVAVVTYFGSIVTRRPAEIVLAYEYDDAVGAEAKAAVAEEYVDGAYDTSETYNVTIQGMSNHWANWKTWGEGFSVDKMFGYEGGWSPDYWPTLPNSLSPVTGATQAASCVLTLATTTVNSGGSRSGNAAVVGKAISLSSVGGMTALNCTSFTATFSNGSANVSGANALIEHQAVVFTSTATLPSNITVGRAYYVVSTGNPFQVSETRGGSAITMTGAGTGTITAQPAWFVTVVAGNSVTIDVNSTGFSAWTSGGSANYVYSNTLMYRLRYATKSSPLVKEALMDLYDAFIVEGGEDPSQFLLGGSSSADITVAPPASDASGASQVWQALDPHIYVADSPSFEAISEWNAAL